MEIKRIIFDVDKTLIGAIDFSGTVERVLKAHDRYSKGNVEAFVRAMLSYEATHDYYEKNEYLSHINTFLEKEVDMGVIEDYLKELRYCVPEPIEGVEDALHNLKCDGYELVALTNYFASSQRSRLETLGISKYISKIYGENHCKPSKLSYLEACENYFPDECLMVGDNYVIDVIVPSYLGLNTIYVTGLDNSLNTSFTEVKSVKDINKELILKMK